MEYKFISKLQYNDPKILRWMDSHFAQKGDKFDFEAEIHWLIDKGYMWEPDMEELKELIRYCIDKIQSPFWKAFHTRWWFPGEGEDPWGPTVRAAEKEHRKNLA